MSQLEEIKARAEKATEGPWKVWGMQVLADPVGDSNVDTALPIADTTDPHRGLRTFNAEFIAHARTDVPKLIAALEAVEALHRKVPVYMTEAGDCKHGGDCESVEIDGESMCPDETEGYTCGYCAELNTEEYPDYPCSTAKVITEALQ